MDLYPTFLLITLFDAMVRGLCALWMRSAAALYILVLRSAQIPDIFEMYLAKRATEQGYRAQLDNHLAVVPLNRYPNHSHLDFYNVADPETSWVCGLETVWCVSLKCTFYDKLLLTCCHATGDSKVHCCLGRGSTSPWPWLTEDPLDPQWGRMELQHCVDPLDGLWSIASQCQWPNIPGRLMASVGP